MKALDFLILRTPLQSLELAFAESTLELPPMFVNGLRHAAPAFYKELIKEKPTNEKEGKKIQDSLYKYWLRSCTRCTPYGFFAGYADIKIGTSQSSIILDRSGKNIIRPRLDIGYLSLLKSQIEQLDYVESQLKYQINNSLYETHSDYRYVEYVLNENVRTYKLSSVEKTKHLRFIFNCVKNSITIAELTAKLSQYSGVTQEQATNFIKEMISCQLLVSELELTLSGIDPLSDLTNKLEKLNGTTTIVDKLKEIYSYLNNINNCKYEDVELQVSQVFNLKGKVKDIIHIDLSITTVENTVNKVTIDQIVDQADDLHSLARLGYHPNLDIFKRRFLERYESAEMPLNIVLDDDLGIGYGEKSETDNWLPTIPTNSVAQESSIYQDFITKYTFRKYQDFVINNKKEIEVTEQEIKEFPKNNYIFSPSSYLFGSLLGEIDGDNPNFLFHLDGFANSSTATILGRFTLGDEKLTELAKSTVENDEASYPDAIFAEICHIPQARAGNIIVRSSMRKYEIPYLGNSGLPNEFQIPISDLMVSVRDNQVVLRSIKNNKRVFPRLSSSHNFNGDNLPVYKFLCDMQFQSLGQADIWDWGSLKEEAHLPRVRYKNLILRKAKWVVTEIDIKAWPKNTKVDAFQKAIANFREERGLPRLVSLIQGDNNLLIDLENPRSVSLLVNYIKKNDTIVLEEFLFTKENCVVKDIDGFSYTNEIIIPVIRDFQKQNLLTNSLAQSVIQRKFPPSSEWLYIKIYGGEKTLEKVLMNSIYALMETGLEKKYFEKFFFIRYTDPGKHLRLRFFNTNFQFQADFQKVIMDVLRPHLDSEQLEKIVIDTYQREIERYSEELIIEAESLFFYDSLCVLRLNKLLSEVEESQKYRIILAMRGIDYLLNDFNLNLREKSDLTKDMSDDFMREFGGSVKLRQIINHKYREIQKEIFSNMDVLDDEKNEINDAIAIFKNRSYDNVPVVSKIKKKLELEENSKRMDTLLRDFIHMHMNRLFSDHQRKYELFVYSFLERYYSSQNSIHQKSKKLVFNNYLRGDFKNIS